MEKYWKKLDRDNKHLGVPEDLEPYGNWDIGLRGRRPITSVNEQGEIVKKRVQKKGRKRATTKRKVKCETVTKPLDGPNTKKGRDQSEKRKRVSTGQQNLKMAEIDLTIDEVEPAGEKSLRAQVPSEGELTASANIRELIPLEPQEEEREELVPDEPLHPDDVAAAKEIRTSPDPKQNVPENEQLQSQNKIEEEINRLLSAPSEQRRPLPNTPIHQVIQQWVTFGFIEISNLSLQEKQQLLQMQGILDQLYVLFGKQLAKTKDSEAQNEQLQNTIRDLKREKQYLELQKELLEIKMEGQRVGMTNNSLNPAVDSDDSNQ